MARSREQKAESRRAIVDSAAKLFREKGIDGVTVAEIMEAPIGTGMARRHRGRGQLRGMLSDYARTNDLLRVGEGNES